MDKSVFSYNKLLQSLEKEYGEQLPERIINTFRLAYDAHLGQFRATQRTDVQIPFIVHPLGTAINAIHYFTDISKFVSDSLETIVCVSLAHDLLEDTRVDLAALDEVAGKEVRFYVEALTKPPAGVIGKSSTVRNSELAEKIMAAGPTAVYVKLCDNLQNLSRPSITPFYLFKKILQKTEIHYLPMLNHRPLGDNFRRLYEETINQAKVILEKEHTQLSASDRPMTLAEALRVCVRESAGKILELHDIPLILAAVCEADKVGIWSVTGKFSDTLTLICGFDNDEHPGRVKVPDLSEYPRRLRGKSLTLMAKAMLDPTCQWIFTVPMNVSGKAVYIVSMSFNDDPPEWVTIDTVTVLAQFLAHRLIVSEADRRLSLAGEMTKLGIQIDVELAARMGMTPTELNQIQLWRGRCKQAILTTEHLVKGFLASGALKSPLAELIRIESRVKSIDAIMQKFKISSSARKWPDYESLEDIAGVRVVCPSLSELRSIERFLLESETAHSKIRLHPDISDNRRDYLVKPLTSGYTALHFIFEVDVLGENGPMTVPCEVQLRTIFMDIWAAISHLTLYQASHNTRRRKGDLLKELGIVMARAEEIAAKIVERL